MGIKLFAVDIVARLNDSVYDWLKYFSSPRRKDILSYRFNADRNRTVFAELLVRNVIAKELFCPIESVKVYRDDRGKPYIEALPVEISL